ncbi:MAG: hypothetical protein KGO96_12270 [Elusimicrobia bacterium]|nr:hypothetical protein [Elusimicrobiota bacterium]
MTQVVEEREHPMGVLFHYRGYSLLLKDLEGKTPERVEELKAVARGKLVAMVRYAEGEQV